MQSQAGARRPPIAAGTAHQQPSPGQQGMVSLPYGSQPAYQGTLAPGTRLMIGQIVVTVQKYLSQGGFAHVYLVTTDKPIAMPVSATSAPGSTSSSTRGETLHVLKRMAVPDKEALASVRSEVDVHKSLRNHPNIVHFIEASATALQGGGYEIFILMEYCSGGGIIDLMNSRLRNRLTEAEVLKIFGDVAAGLSVMHHMDPPLMHRDLKVENILLAPPPRSSPSVGPTYKLCDFGSTTPILSRRAPKSLEEVKRLEADLNKCTTLQYRAPEMVDVYQRRIIDEKADVWAMGVLLYKLCYYTTPFEENGGGPLAILNARYRFPQMPAYSQRLKDLIASMLQEQSTSRPTIDQVIIGVHRILGTTPPASTLHYADLSAKGKQMQPLPSLVSSKPISGSGADVAAKAMALHQSKAGLDDHGPAGGVSRDLIEIGPSESERRRVEEEEFKKRNEAITPMRRGRPNRLPTTSITAESIRSTSPVKATSSASLPPSQPARNQQQEGFADSFSPPVATSTSLAPAPQPPPRPASGLHYSPSLPGMDPSNRISPLPKPSTPLAQPNNVSITDEEANTRFPSVEELDLQYGTGSTSSKNYSATRTPVTSPPPAILSSSQSKANVIPGLSERAPVSAIAGKFGSMSSSTRINGTNTPTITSPTLSGKGGGGGTSSLAKRWPHQDTPNNVAKASYSAPSKEPTPPTLPSRKPQLKDWLMDDDDERRGSEGKQKITAPSASTHTSATAAIATDNAAGTELNVEEGDSSEDEDSRPEDVNESIPVTRKRQSLMGKGLFEERREAARDRNSTWNKPESTVSSATTGKVKKPDWLQQEKEAGKSGTADSTSRDAVNNRDLLESTQEERGDAQGETIAAAAPAWDEDDEEMHFLPQPDLNTNQRYTLMNQQGRQAAAAPIQSKRYVDASTSPGRGSPVVISPSSAPIQQTSTAPPSVMQRNPPPIFKEQKPASFASPKPIRSQSIKDVSGLVSKYQDLSVSKSDDSKSSTIDSGSSSITLSKHDDGAASPMMISQELERGGGGSNYSSSIQQRKESLVNGSRPKPITSTSGGGPPPVVHSSKPNLWSRKELDGNRMSKKSETMKPWEREAAEKEQVDKYGSLRSASPGKSTFEREGEEGRGGAKDGHEAQERFSGVSSLISQWQANSSKGAPGWGTVGGGLNSSNSSSSSASMMGRLKSKEEEDIIKRSSTIGTMAGRNAMQGRLVSRDV